MLNRFKSLAFRAVASYGEEICCLEFTKWLTLIKNMTKKCKAQSSYQSLMVLQSLSACTTSMSDTLIKINSNDQCASAVFNEFPMMLVHIELSNIGESNGEQV